MINVALYGKPNCHLCEQALEVIESVRMTHPFELAVVNILNDWDAYERFKHDIPVIFLNGAEIARHRLDAQLFTSAIIQGTTPHRQSEL